MEGMGNRPPVIQGWSFRSKLAWRNRWIMQGVLPEPCFVDDDLTMIP